MSRINTNVQSLIAQRVLTNNNQALGQSLERLSTGLRINRGKDDPAGLIASENLRAEKSSLNAAIGNATRADQVANIAEGGLQEVSNLLTELQGLITTSANTAGLSTQEKEANQLQVDSILQTIDRIADATGFQGTKLLNGNYDYTVESIDAGVSDFRVNGAKLTKGQNLDVEAIVTQSAQKAGLLLNFNASQIDLGTGSSFTFEVAGALGSRELSFSSGATVDNIVAAINTFSDVTGVKAEAFQSGSGNTGVKLVSSEYGSDQFVSVKVVDDGAIGSATGVGIFQLQSDDFSKATGSATAFGSANNGIRDKGQDIAASINGIKATATGRTASINTDFLNVEITFNDDSSNNAAQTLDAVSAFSITGGGADFQLASSVDIAGKVSIGIKDVSTRKLGNSSVGYLDDLANGQSSNVVDGDLTGAQKIVDEAIRQVSSARGRLGAFQKNTVGATIRNLNISLENTAAAESVIRDADFAAETAALTRNQILQQASTQVLSLANSQPQAALSLLG